MRFDRIAIIASFISFSGLAISQSVPNQKELKEIIIQLDKNLFTAAFENCDTLLLESMVEDNCIFYHDQTGIIPDKSTFLEVVKNGLCKLPYKASRILDTSSVEIFPMNDNGKLYGVLQTGIHRFYAQYEGKEKVLTSTAKFSHLWTVKEGLWQIVNILSYDHK